MRRLAPQPRTRLLSVYATASVSARRESYRRLEHAVLEETGDCLVTEGGFRSEHFSPSEPSGRVCDSSPRQHCVRRHVLIGCPGTTMIYIHGLNRGPAGVRTRADRMFM